jgi:hypothetical protein
MVTASGVAGEGGRWGPDAKDAAISCHITVVKSLASDGDPHRSPPHRGGIPIDTCSEEVPLSHIVTIKTEVRDQAAIGAACRRLGLPEPVHGAAQLFSGEATGLLVKLPDWLYPVVVDTTTGQVRYDNYNGAWGDQAQLDRFLQIYAVEKARIEARKKGHQVTEQSLADGSIKLTIRVGGGS